MLVRRSLRALVTAMALTLIAIPATAQTIWYVDDDAPNDPGPGDVASSDPLEDGSQTHPFDAIQEAIGYARNGDTVLVADGTYTGNGNRAISIGTKSITLQSAGGADTCVIDCETAARGVYLYSNSDNAFTMYGFTITGGNGVDKGAAIYCEGSCYATIIDCVLTGNTAVQNGGGFWAKNGVDATLINCNIYNNRATNLYGGGVFNSNATITLINCLVTENYAGRLGGGTSVGDGGVLSVENCTIARNSAGTSGGGLRAGVGTTVVVNTIIAHNDAPDGVEVSVAGLLDIEYSDILGGAASILINSGTLNWGQGNIETDPLLADILNRDYHLTEISPCIDAGTNDPPSTLWPVELDGYLRVQDGDGDVEAWTGVAATVDLGVYEANTLASPLICMTPETLVFDADAGSTTPQQNTLSIFNCGLDVLDWEIVESCDWLSATPTAGDSSGELDDVTITIDPTGLINGLHVCELLIVAANASNSPQTVTISLVVGPDLHVPLQYPTIQTALDAAQSGSRVIVADGTYTGDDNKRLDFGGKAITLESQGGAGACIIDCEGNGNAFIFNDDETQSAVVDGFTIINGDPTSSVGSGGGIYCVSGSSPTIKNCAILDCQTRYHGGGVFIHDGDPVLINCLIAGNTADQDGGGIFAETSQFTLVNCTITGNTTGDSGGGAHIQTTSNATIVNSIFANNAAARGTDVALLGPTYPSTLTISYSQVTGGQTAVRIEGACTLNWGDGMVDSDPAFVDPTTHDYHLTLGSPCIDAGTNTPSIGLPLTDLDGNPRLQDGDGDVESWTGVAATTDMGALELRDVTTPAICATPAQLVFYATWSGPDPADQLLEIWNCGIDVLNWQVDSTCDWLSLDPTAGDSSGEVDTVTVSVAHSGLGVGEHTCTIEISDPQAAWSPVSIPVTLYVGSPLICVDPPELAFTTVDPTADVPDQSLTLTNCGGGILDWEATTDCSWLSIAPTTGTLSENASRELTLSANPVGMAAGVHTGTVEITDPLAANSPLTVTVTLVVGADIYVPIQYATIQEAVDAAQVGDVIVVADGTYTGEGNRNIDFDGKEITLRSQNGPATCVIDGEGVSRGFLLQYYEGPETLIEGFTVVNGTLGLGGAIKCRYSAPTIRNCVFENCSATSYGGAVYAYRGDVTLDACTIRGCEAARHGGGISSSGFLTLTNCLIVDNEAGGQGGALMMSSTDATISNCTIVNNSALVAGGGLYATNTDVALTNTIVAFNDAPTGSEVNLGDNDDDSVLTATYSAIAGGLASIQLNSYTTLEWGEGMTAATPVFGDPTAGDYRLFGLTGVDAGTNDPPDGLTPFDIAGNPRPTDDDGDVEPWTGQAATAEMGAYEGNWTAAPAICTDAARLQFLAGGGLPPADQTVAIWNCGTGTTTWEITEDCPWLTVTPTTGSSDGTPTDVTFSVDISGLDTGDHVYTVEIVDPAAWNSPATIKVHLEIGSDRHVPSEYETIQEAIDAALPHDAIIVADGTYTGSGNRGISFRGKTLVLRSENGPANCIINCQTDDNAFELDQGESNEAVIEGFTIINGDNGSTSGGAIRCTNNATPTIRNCIIADCRTGNSGGAIYCSSAGLTLEQCIIRNNYAGSAGGGIYCRTGEYRFINCLIYENKCGTDGGGVSCSGTTATLTNCTITDNVAGDAGGGIHIQTTSDAAFTNCIIAHNTGVNGNDISLAGETNPSTLTVAHCNVPGGSNAVRILGDCTLNWDSGNLEDDPQFLDPLHDDYRIAPASLCIDGGTNSPPNGLPAFDLVGAERAIDGNGQTEAWTGVAATADMGVFELPAADLTAICTASDEFAFRAVEGTPLPEAQVLSLWNCGVDSLEWSIESDCEWLDIWPASGISTGEVQDVQLSLNVSTIEPGVYTCVLEIVSATAMNSPRTVEVSLAYGAQRYVPSEHESIQAAIDASGEGDVVIVADGTYTGRYNRNLDYNGKNITVRSENGPAACVLDCGGSSPAFNFHDGETADAVVDGFTITNGYTSGTTTPNGAGIYCCYQSSPTIRNCIITNCSTPNRGGGFAVSNGSPTLINCLIAANSAGDDGGGVFCTQSALTLINCTIAGNTASDVGGGAYFQNTSTVNIVNSIIAHNSAGSTPEIALFGATYPASLAISFSNVLGGEESIRVEESCTLTWGEGNVDTDPLFRHLASGDARLVPGSPCVDAGTNDPPGGLPATDIDGGPRPVDGDGDFETWSDQYATADMGTHELPEGLLTALCVEPLSLEFDAPRGTESVEDQFLSISNCGSGDLKWSISTDCAWLSIDPAGGVSTGEANKVTLHVDLTGLAVGEHFCTLEVTGVDALAAPQFVDVTLLVGGDRHVPSEYETIQAALDAAFDGDHIVVADGIYTGVGNRNLDPLGKTLTVRSANGPLNCTIDCEQASRAFSLGANDENVIAIDGFTIVNGRTTSSSGGGSIYCPVANTLTVRNCIISAASTTYNGGAVHINESEASLANCIIVGNHAGRDGGGVYASSATLSLVNCTIADNTASDESGGLHVQTTSTATLENCIIAYNTANNGDELTLAGSSYPSTMTVTYCDILGGIEAVRILGDSTLNWETGNIDGEPGFVDRALGDYHLLPGAACVDAGTNTPSTGLPATDFEGDARPIDGDGNVEQWSGQAATADIGADEIVHGVQPIISIEPAALSFATPLSQPVPQAQVVSIHNGGLSTLRWQITEDCQWLTVTPTSGESTGEIDYVTFSVDGTGLSPSRYECTVQITDPNAFNNPQTIEVVFVLGNELHVPSEYATIQAAIDAADPGDHIIVADGTYTGAGNKAINYSGKDLVVRSENGPAHCTIDCEHNLRAFWFTTGETSDSVVDGFTIINGDRSGSADGAGIACYNGSNPTILNCVVRDCYAGRYGGGVYAHESNPTLINCMIVNNEAGEDGGGVFCNSSNMTIVNCTIADNTADDECGGLAIERYSTVAIANTIVAFNTAPTYNEIAVRYTHYPSTLSVSYSDILGGQEAVYVAEGCTLNWGDGMIDADPVFLDRTASDYRIIGTPCIDAGTNEPPGGLPETDFEGDPRPLDGDGDMESWSGQAATADIGADELVGQLSPAICVDSATFAFVKGTGEPDPDEQTLSLWNCGLGTLQWQVVENCDWLTATPNAGESTGETDTVALSVDPTGLPEGFYRCTLEVTATAATNNPLTINVSLRIGDALYVPYEYATIQAAVDAATAGNEIIVADGTYTGEGNRGIDFGGKDVMVRSQDGPANCIIDCENEQRAFWFHNGETDQAVVDGFTILNGRRGTLGGGAISCTDGATPIIRNCVISGCYSGVQGGAIYSHVASITLEQCVIHSNTAATGGAIHCGAGDVRLANCLIFGNHANEDVGGVNLWQVHATIVNCTIVDNTADGQVGGLRLENSAQVTLTNSIVGYNSATEYDQISLRAEPFVSILTTSYSDILGGQAAVNLAEGCTLNWGEGMIDADPIFVDRPAGDYHLLGLDCVDAGTNEPAGGLPAVDFEGDARPIDGDGDVESWSGQSATADIGADERAGLVGPIICTDANAFEFESPVGNPTPAPQTLTIWNCGPGTLNWQITGDCAWLTLDVLTGQSSGEATAATLTADPTGLATGTYSCTLIITAAEAVNSPHAVEIELRVGGDRYVPDDYATIQAAINDAMPGDHVVVQDGIYTGEGNRDLDCLGKSITLRSANGPHNCIIDCENQARAVSFPESQTNDATVDGFTIRNGRAGEGGGIRCGSLSSPTIRNCIFSDCFTTGEGGGAIYCKSSATKVVNCLITGNTTNGQGGGVCCGMGAMVTLLNCTIADNGRYGLYLMQGSTAAMRNCVIAYNTGYEVYLAGQTIPSQLTVAYSGIHGGRDAVYVTPLSTLHWNSGNIDDAPSFVDHELGDYHLLSGAAHIDAGTNNPPGGLPAYDLDGKQRIVDGDGDLESWTGQFQTVDMGAFEEQSLNTPAICLNAHSFEFFALVGQPSPDSQTLEIENCGYGTLDWTIDYECAWLTVAPTSGQSNHETDLVTLTVDISNLSAGSYTCELVVSAPDAANNPRVVEVVLNIGTERHVPFEHTTIQNAVNASSSGDHIIVADGTYTGTGNRGIDFGGKRLVLRSENGPAACVIDCEQADNAFYLHSGEPASTLIEGFTIINGATDSNGGAVSCENQSHLTLRDCRISDCTSYIGGAVYCSDATIRLENCSLYANTSSVRGGAVSSIIAEVAIVGCAIYDNNNGGHFGGATVDIRHGHFTMTDSLICNNHANYVVGGCYCFSTEAEIQNCTFAGNSCNEGAGGLQCDGTSVVWLMNSIVAHNTSADGSEILVTGEYGLAVLGISYCSVLGGVDSIVVEGSGNELIWGDGMVGDDPRFVDLAGGDFHLDPTSSCIDAGTNDSVLGLYPQDLDGADRLIDGDGDFEAWTGQAATVDMGAYESPLRTGGDFDGDADLDADDYAIFLAAYGSCIGDVAYTALADLDDSGCIDALDYQIWLALYREFVNNPDAPPPGGRSRIQRQSSQSRLLP